MFSQSNHHWVVFEESRIWYSLRIEHSELAVVSLLPVPNVVSRPFKLATKTVHVHFYNVKVASLRLPGTPSCSVPICSPFALRIRTCATTGRNAFVEDWEGSQIRSRMGSGHWMTVDHSACASNYHCPGESIAIPSNMIDLKISRQAHLIDIFGTRRSLSSALRLVGIEHLLRIWIVIAVGHSLAWCIQCWREDLVLSVRFSSAMASPHPFLVEPPLPCHVGIC